MPHPKLRRPKVDVRPAQTEELPAPQAERQGRDEQPVQTMAASRPEERASLLVCPQLYLMMIRCRRLDQLDHIPNRALYGNQFGLTIPLLSTME